MPFTALLFAAIFLGGFVQQHFSATDSRNCSPTGKSGEIK